MSSKLPLPMQRAISNLVLTQEFWASIVLHLRFVEVKEPPPLLAPFAETFRAGTDGTHLFYSRKFMEGLTPAVASFVLAHEAAHAMLLHLVRIYEASGIGGNGFTYHKDKLGRKLAKDPTLWNCAGDYVINLMLKDSGFTLWDQCLLDTRFAGMTTEQVYKILKQENPGGGGGTGGSPGGQPDPRIGGDLVMPEAGTDHKTEAEAWKERITAAAAVAKSRGHLPASIEGLIEEMTKPQYPVWHLLEQYVDTCIRSGRDSSWKYPDRTMWPYGIVLPSDYDETIPHVFLWYDTSGSVSNLQLAKFHTIAGDIIRNLHPDRLTIGQCDAGVHGEPLDITKSDDWPTSIKCTGRGGTSFKPPFTWMEEHSIRPTVCVYLTDLEGDFPEFAPPYPVLWVSVNPNTAPWGDTLNLPPGFEDEEEDQNG